MSIGYVWEKYFTAVSTLAAGTGRLQERIHDAYTGALIRLKPEDLPKKHREAFSQLYGRVTSVKARGNEGSIAASTLNMSDDEARKIAEQILSIFNDVARNYDKYDRAERLKSKAAK